MNYPTYRDLLDACIASRTRKEATEVLAKAKEDNPEAAESNIGYLFGYLDEAERRRLYALFPTCSHPVFGAAFGRGYEPTLKEAFEIGLKRGKQLKAEEENRVISANTSKCRSGKQ